MGACTAKIVVAFCKRYHRTWGWPREGFGKYSLGKETLLVRDVMGRANYLVEKDDMKEKCFWGNGGVSHGEVKSEGNGEKVCS